MSRIQAWIGMVGICCAMASGTGIAAPDAAASPVRTAAAVRGPARSMDLDRLERVIDLRVSTGQFMGSVLVAVDGTVVLSKGYGKASLADNLPNTPTTKFRLGSVTKQFTAAGILLLEERGKLKVEDLVRKYLPDAPSAWNSITIYHLLTHTSGIPNFTSFPDYRSTESVAQTPEQVVARFRDKSLNFAPGAAWEYSNSGYVLLGYLIEKISGESYAQFVHDNLLAPLGMKDTGYDSSTQRIERHAVGYAPGPSGPVPAGFIDMSIPFSAGALYSTTEDMLRWEQGLFGGKVLQPASLQKMTTPFRNDYAMGLGVRPLPNGGKVIEHNGGIEGFNSLVAYVPADKLVIVVLANLNGPAADEIGVDLRKAAENEPGTLLSDRLVATLPAAALDRLAGHYRMDGRPLMTVTRKDDHLQVEGIQRPVDLYPQSATAFFAKTGDLQAVFESDAQGRVTGAAVTMRGLKSHAARISAAEAQQEAEALATRVRVGTPRPGSDAAARKTLADLANGTPDYSKLSPDLAAATRQQLPMLQPGLQRLGAMQSSEFKGVDPNGADIYDVHFERGGLEVHLFLGADGVVMNEFIRPLPP